MEFKIHGFIGEYILISTNNFHTDTSLENIDGKCSDDYNSLIAKVHTFTGRIRYATSTDVKHPNLVWTLVPKYKKNVTHIFPRNSHIVDRLQLVEFPEEFNQ